MAELIEMPDGPETPPERAFVLDTLRNLADDFTYAQCLSIATSRLAAARKLRAFEPEPEVSK